MLQQENWTYDKAKKLLVPPKMKKRKRTSMRTTADILERRESTKYESGFTDFAKLTEIAMVLKGR